MISNFKHIAPEKRISLLLIILFAVFLPFDRFYSQLVLVFYIIHWIIHIKRSSFKNLPIKKLLLLQSVYLLTMIGTAYSFHHSEAFGLWEKQLAILLLPILIFTDSINIKKHTHLILLCFVIMNVLAIMWLYFDAFKTLAYYNMPVNELFKGNFFSHKFSEPIELHATYLSLYCSLSLIILIQNLISRKYKNLKWLNILSIIILSGGILQLASRSVIFASLLVLLFIVPFYIRSKKNKTIYLAVTVLATISFILLVLNQPGFTHRFIAEVKHDLSLSNAAYSLADPRIERWKIAWDLFRQSPWIGHGTGEEIILLKQAYFNSAMYDSYLFELNAHNQYLSFMIKGGLAGLAVYLICLLYFLKWAIKSKNLVFIGFLVLIIITGISENLLNVNKGIFFYAFFLSLFACGEWKFQKKSRDIPSFSNQNKEADVYTMKPASA